MRGATLEPSGRYGCDRCTRRFDGLADMYWLRDEHLCCACFERQRPKPVQFPPLTGPRQVKGDVSE